MKIVNESLEYKDMEEQLDNTITVDEYSAKMGKDSDIVTVTFIVYSKMAAEDLVSWLEKGYDWVLDASVSDGEISPGKWLVFVELQRRRKVPDRIIEILTDLETLTEYKLSDWKVDVIGDQCPADVNILRKKIVLNPNEYKMEKEVDEELNEFRNIAGLNVNSVYKEDEYIRNLKNIAGL